MSVATLNPDTTPPELDLNIITISAFPTQPDAPNGETAVSIEYKARDDKVSCHAKVQILVDTHTKIKLNK